MEHHRVFTVYSDFGPVMLRYLLLSRSCAEQEGEAVACDSVGSAVRKQRAGSGPRGANLGEGVARGLALCTKEESDPSSCVCIFCSSWNL